MKWLKNFERVQEIQQQIIWQPVSELDPRAFIPEFLKATLHRQPCERLLASPKRQLLHEGPLTLLEISKTVEMYMFLFDDILLLTRVKKAPRKHYKNSLPESHLLCAKPHTDGAIFVVHKQPIALDRFTLHDVHPPDTPGLWEFWECGVHTVSSYDDLDLASQVAAEDDCVRQPNLFFGCLSTANVLKNAFVIVHISRFQQIIGVYTLQAPNEAAKAIWMTHLKESQENYKEALRKRRPDATADLSDSSDDEGGLAHKSTIPEEPRESEKEETEEKKELKEKPLVPIPEPEKSIDEKRNAESCHSAIEISHGNFSPAVIAGLDSVRTTDSIMSLPSHLSQDKVLKNTFEIPLSKQIASRTMSAQQLQGNRLAVNRTKSVTGAKSPPLSPRRRRERKTGPGTLQALHERCKSMDTFY
ncbi:DgyrCDS2002 [Dimorphilus gyrociliatus]|uniref:DgyrCDS2002 n=1 Tax=Dimorphilus gyrociliatus TaxID=2664684 RepID=A0A7I8VBS5_9ANNE|nr:DgyrCDS2002 [Dimorphilus gyrociliatus]